MLANIKSDSYIRDTVKQSAAFQLVGAPRPNQANKIKM